MSLLQNEEFAIYQLRTAYLANIRDGVGERLITVNTGFLNDPAYRAAGWSSNPTEIKRTYSPPIPTTVTSDYFDAPPPLSAGLGGFEFGLENEDEGGMVTGAGSHDTVGPVLVPKRRRRREQLEEDDSSDLSDESDEETDAAQRPANQIQFARARGRSDADTRSSDELTNRDNPSLAIISPSAPGASGLRKGSTVEPRPPITRTRADTVTSSEMSSETDLDPSVFRRRKIQRATPQTPKKRLADHIEEDERSAGSAVPDEEADDGKDDGSDSDDSSLISDFSETLGSESLLEGISGPLDSSPIAGLAADERTLSRNLSPSGTQPSSPIGVPELPPPRPISMLHPVSQLAIEIKARNQKPNSPFERFTVLSGKADSSPLYVKIFTPASEVPSKTIEVVLRRQSEQAGPVTVAEAIGFSLWRYTEEKVQPPIAASQMNVNWWTLRIVEDGEVDFDFPALGRARPITDFTYNNNRPVRGRAREKPWDEFALVEATELQFKENDAANPGYTKDAESTKAAQEESVSVPVLVPRPTIDHAARLARLRQNPITDPMFISAALRKDTGATLDTPTVPTMTSTSRTGAPRTINVHFTDNDFMPHATSVEVTTDTYIAEVFDQVCKKMNLEKALYMMKVTNTNTIAPSDRTVEALGRDRSSLDLVRRRFIGDGSFGMSGSPGSTSPNAPLLLTTTGTPKKGKRSAAVHPLAQQSGYPGLAIVPSTTTYKRYNVVRKQPMSFTSSHQRVLALDEEYMHIIPVDSGKDRLFDASQGKTTSIHYSNIVGCKVNRKHPKTLRVVVFKERESKRYDFEAANAAEAAEIVHEIRKGIQPFQELLQA